MHVRRIPSAILVATLGLSIGLGWEHDSGARSGPSPIRTVKGEVVAVTLDATPPVIVLKTQIAGKTDMIVGARLDAKTVVTRHHRPVTLADIETGETVSLVYRKSPDGLIAQSIDIR